MALVRCADCGRDVSDQAPACPGCGRPIARAAVQASGPGKSHAAHGAILVGTFMVLGGLIATIGGCANDHVNTAAIGGVVMFVGLFVFVAGRLL